MKAYQDADPLHGHGKAMPKPKQPTRYTYRGARFGTPVSVTREQMTDVRHSRKAKKAAAQGRRFGVAALVALCARLIRQSSRGR